MDVNLVLLKKSGLHKFFRLPSNVTVIGRRHSCDLCIPLMSVSKKHCQLNFDEGVWKIRDLGSRNGTCLNDKRIDEAVINAGDYIKIGPLTFIFQIDGQPKIIAEPDFADEDISGEFTAMEDTEDEQLEDFPELDELDSLEETGST